MQYNPLASMPEGVIKNKVIISVHEDLVQMISCRVFFIKMTVSWLLFSITMILTT